MYFGYEETVRWCQAVRGISLSHQAITGGAVELFVIPSYPVLSKAREVFQGTNVGLGAQNLHWRDSGPFTGEVSGAMLAEMGCRYVEVGHAERRRMFGETDDIVAAKTAAALRNGLVPIICIGEATHVSAPESLKLCKEQIASAVSLCEGQSRIIAAYEPVWAIGAPNPASPDHIRRVCRGLAEALNARSDLVASVIYGGAAGRGLLISLKGCVDGLFLGRSAHDPQTLTEVFDEVLASQ